MILILTLHTVCIQSMKSNFPRSSAQLVTFIPKTLKTKQPLSPEKYEQYKQCALQAEEYNQTNPLLSMPSEILTYIFFYCQAQDCNQKNSLKESIKFFMGSNSICKHFNEFLTFETIGNLCKTYDLTDKTETLKQLTKEMNGFNYKIKRLPALILICAGADTTTDSCHYLECDNQKVIFKNNFLLQKAVFRNDAQMVTILFKHHTPVDIDLDELGPLFFQIKTAEIAQIFINQGVNAHITEHNCKTTTLQRTKIFQQIIESAYPSELVALYFEHNADAAKFTFRDNSCLLHIFAKPSTTFIDNVENFLKKGALILKAMPNMINTLNKDEQTPLDVAQASFHASKPYGTPEAFEKLIALFRESDAKTAQELKEETYPNCFICMDKHETALEVPCSNPHEQSYLCLTCYSTLLTTSDDCPLCRSTFKK